MNHIPVIDLAARHTAAGKALLAKEIGAACATSGFYVIVGHDVPKELIDRMIAVTNAFFRLPEREKDLPSFRSAGGTTARSMDLESPPDLCESFTAHVTGELPESEREQLGDYRASWKQANTWPRDPSDFKETWHEYLTALSGLAAELLRLSALALGFEEGHFDERFDRHVSALVANYYYPQLTPPLPGQLRRGAHTDFGCLTVLYQEDDLGGLQVWQGQQWVDVRAIPGSFVVNIGDLMALWTGGAWRSTLHRVVNPLQGNTSSRLSVPFFYQPNHDAPAENGTAGQWITQKMEKLFLGVNLVAASTGTSGHIPATFDSNPA
ncbi:isopenicillin N synthase family dioxygenase [Crossiella cryophila]|uniref:Isopenicillin N synthase-like dioxygenase n=1 Tax=Crossiella cryophila TaxID=43355 RepID=A0A7W7C7V2_9PSEU|nr:2OG-Fe(II) oxygenase family protein [Crossiella cryophila]MBB4676095.1 isopenicillin N synthase-like dioxygenase [Crossiella cryophila]